MNVIRRPMLPTCLHLSQCRSTESDFHSKYSSQADLSAISLPDLINTSGIKFRRLSSFTIWSCRSFKLISEVISTTILSICEIVVGDGHWWTEKELYTLTHKSMGLFIFASTAVKFINDEYDGNPRQQLNVILGVHTATSTSPFQDLDALYQRVLSDAIPDTDTGELSGLIKAIVGAIVLIFDTLPSGSLESLLHVEAPSVKAAVGKLHSVIVSPLAQDQPICFQSHRRNLFSLLFTRWRPDSVYSL
jgi:hypothetical protein